MGAPLRIRIVGRADAVRGDLAPLIEATPGFAVADVVTERDRPPRRGRGTDVDATLVNWDAEAQPVTAAIGRAALADPAMPVLQVGSSLARGPVPITPLRGRAERGASSAELIAGLRAVAAGGAVRPWAPRDALRPCRERQAPLADLTDREAQVLALFVERFGNVRIGLRMGVVPGTVAHHGTRIFRKLGVEDRYEAAWWAEGRPADYGAP